MPTEPDPPKELEHLLKHPDYERGYRAGALAERARVVELCARARNVCGTQIDSVLSLGNKVLQAGDAIPVHVDDDDTWLNSVAVVNAIRRLPEDTEISATKQGRLQILERRCAKQQEEIEELLAELKSRVG